MEYQLTDDALAAAVRIANIPTLLAALWHVTGDASWLADPYPPSRPKPLSDNDDGGLTPQLQQQVRDAAFAVFRDWRDDGRVGVAQATPEQLVHVLGVSMHDTIPAEYGPMMREDLERAGLVAGVDRPAAAPSSGRTALIIGAGISGLTAAMTLHRAGVEYEILERDTGIGGTWWRNRYPGVGVDTPGHLYSWPHIRHDWRTYFPLGPDLQSYVERVAHAEGVAEHVRTSTTVESATWDEADARWVVRFTGPDGTQERRVDILVSAVGGFNRPRTPDFRGLDAFAGEIVHTNEWPDDLDLTGKRVGVIGTGATAMQVVPAIVDQVGELVVFQRTPGWIAPFEKLHVEVPAALRPLLMCQPHYAWWYRTRLQWAWNDIAFPSLRKDPGWEFPERSLNAANDSSRRYFTRYAEQKLASRPELVEKVLPSYPPYGKRILLDNGWYDALCRDHVQLVTGTVGELTEKGVVSDGEEHPVDVVVLATGFDVVRFVSTYEVTGRGGRTLREAWNDDDARAHLGTTVPGFPNLFLFYGPNLQGGHGGTLIWTIERQADLMATLIDGLLDSGSRTIEVREEPFDAYNAEVDERHENLIWTHPGMTTYYRNSAGRVVVPTPFRSVDYWHRVHDTDLADYVLA